MADIEHIFYQPMKRVGTEWVSNSVLKPIEKFSQIFFQSGEPWKEANRFAFYKLHGSTGNSLGNITASMNHLKAYVDWLEDNYLDWRYFPKSKKERCLFRFRGFLIEQRDKGFLSPSYTSERMSRVIQFYRYVQTEKLIDDELTLWTDNNKTFEYVNSVGFSRTMLIASSELTIPNRNRQGLKLEDGLLPITSENRAILLDFLRTNQMYELYLMHMIGFYTGARSETIRTLRISSLENAYDDPQTPNFKKIKVGPGTRVKTKFESPLKS